MLYPLLIALGLGLTATGTRWAPPTVVLWAGLWAGHLWVPRRLRLRRALLADDGVRPG